MNDFLLTDKAEVFDNEKEIENIFFSLNNGRAAKVYENDLFIEKGLLSNLLIKKTPFKTADFEQVKKNNSRWFRDKPLKKEDVNEVEFYPDGVDIFSFIYDYMNPRYTVETFKEFKGPLGISTTVYLYIKELNTAIISDFLKKEDLLNLLTIKGLKVFVAALELCPRGLFMYELIPGESLVESVLQEIKDREAVLARVEAMIKQIKPRLPLDKYLSFENEKEVLATFRTMDREETRALQKFMLSARDNEAYNLVAGNYDILQKFCSKVQPAELVFQSMALVEHYKRTNEELLKKDFDRNHQYFLRTLKYKINFTEYKLLMVEFNKKYRAFHKWVNELFDIIERNTAAVKNPINTESVQYKAGLDVAEALSKIWFVSEVILFGSVSRGLEKPLSDVDIAFRVGIPLKKLTKARAETLFRIVKETVLKVEKKYADFGRARYDNGLADKSRITGFYVFDLLGLSFQMKKDREMYERAGFLEGSTVLFKRDSFTVEHKLYSDTVKYDDIYALLVPLRKLSTYVIQKISEDDSKINVRWIKYGFPDETNDSNGDFKLEFVAFQYIDKNQRPDFHNINFKANRNVSESIRRQRFWDYHSDKEEEEVNFIQWEAMEGGIRLLQ